MYSMTGYGKAEYCENGIDLLVEIKTVNNRIFDFNSKMPRAFLQFEGLARKIVSSYIIRGRIDFFVTFTDKQETENLPTVNIAKAENYYKIGDVISEKLSIKNDLTVSSLIRLPDVIEDNSAYDVSKIETVFTETVKKACESLNEMRKAEGEKLILDMKSRMETIKSFWAGIKERAPLVAKEYKQKLAERIEEALEGVEVDQARLLNEVAFFTDKSNIDEELTRLNSHINQFLSLLEKDGMGKKLDFLMQEFNRETNTICSKSNDLTITNIALSLKNEIEKVREQVQNLE